MKIIEFEFDLDQRVITSFNEDGIIESLAFDEGGKKYWVKTKINGNWWKEADLQAK